MRSSAAHRDLVYNPRWDRDGDGIPNRYDRNDRACWDRGGYGTPHRNDRGDRTDRSHRDTRNEQPRGGRGR